MLKKLFVLVFVLISNFATGQTFPGAEGYGANWTFSSDYEVRIVTNLNDSGTGSLRTAITSSSSREAVIIVFNGLSGIIDLNDEISFPTGHQTYVAGQTSENGIVVHGGDWDGALFKFRTTQNGHIVRGIFFDRDGSPWTNGAPTAMDCIQIGSYSNVSYAKNIIFDRCVMTSGSDDLFQLWQTSENITLQNCLLAEPIGRGDSGIHIGAITGADAAYRGAENVTFYNNSWVSIKSRNPSWHRSGSNGEYINNVIYNALSDATMFYDNGTPLVKNFNFIGNHYIDGPETNLSYHNRPAIKSGSTTKIYVEGNKSFHRDSDSDDEWSVMRQASSSTNVASSSQRSLTKWNTPLKDVSYISSTTEMVAHQRTTTGTFAQIDKMLAFKDDIENGTGSYKYNNDGPLTPKYSYIPASISAGSIINDSDNDGIPNSEEATWGGDTFGYVNNLALVGGDTSINANAGQDVSICSGENTTLTASGGSTYLWSTGATTNSITVNPTSTQTYTVTASDSNGNSDSDDVIVTVNSTTANAGTDVTIEEGNSTTLTASGGGSYLWNTGATTESITISPLSTQTYSVIVTLNGCEDTDEVIVTVNPSTSVTANAGQDVSICSGESTTLTASGGSSYLWNTGATTNSITVSPSSTQTYTVTASDSNGNSDSDDVIVTVNSVTANAGTDVTIDEGQSTTLNASGGGTYLWNTGATTQSITVSPLSNQTYSVIVTLNGCEDSDAVNVTVNPSTGSVTANAGQDVSICSGESTTLTASGGTSYLWNTGATTNSITVSPNSTQTYIVTASDSNGNSDSDDVIVTVNNVTANAGVNVTIDEGNSTTLTASGGGSYLWSTGATTASITVSPSATTTYSVIVSLNGCEDTDQVNVTVNPTTGSVTANAGQDVSICSGESTTLTATGGSTYLWSTGATTNSITVNPNATQTYTVTVSDSNGNSDSDDVVVTVNSVTANAGADVTIDEGNSTTLTASGGGSYLWSTGATTESITISPLSTQTYSVTVVLNGCEDTDQVNVIVNPYTGPVIANAGEDVTICLEESVILTASGGTSYLWNTGETTSSITVSPTTTTVYSVTVSDGNSIDVDDLTVIVDETCSGISYRLNVKQTKFYPNPTKDVLNIELLNFSNESAISIFDLKGRIVYSEILDNYSPVKIFKHQINLSNYGKGIYFVRLTNSDYREVKKVLVY